MKKWLWILSVIACNQSTQMESSHVIFYQHPELLYQKGEAYFKSEPYTGTIIDSFPNGQLKFEKRYNQGLLNDTSFLFHPNGQLREFRLYSGNLENGTQMGFFSDGKKRFSYDIKAGEFHGKVLEWHSNGRLARQYYYHLGKEKGLQQAWDSTGKLIVNCEYKNGRRYGMENPEPCYILKDEQIQSP